MQALGDGPTLVLNAEAKSTSFGADVDDPGKQIGSACERSGRRANGAWVTDG
jgi:hypothetical protein